MRALTAVNLNVRTLIGQHGKLPCIYTHAIVSYSQLVIKKSKCKLGLVLHATQRKSARYAISQSRASARHLLHTAFPICQEHDSMI